MLKNMHCLGLGHFIEFLPVNLENVRSIITSGLEFLLSTNESCINSEVKGEACCTLFSS